MYITSRAKSYTIYDHLLVSFRLQPTHIWIAGVAMKFAATWLCWPYKAKACDKVGYIGQNWIQTILKK
jgi:hypothetical protein